MKIGVGLVFLIELCGHVPLAICANWTEVDAGLPRSPVGVSTVVVDPSSPSTIYALAYSPAFGYIPGGLFKSTDGGDTWNVIPGVSSVNALVIDPSDSSTLYAVHGGVSKSTNGGQTWTDTGFGQNVSALAIDPQNTSTLYAMTGGAIFKTTSGGASWSPKTTGLPALLLGGYMAIDPVHPSTIFAAVGTGLYRSTDAGESWRGPLVQGGYCRCPVAIDPVNPSNVYAVLLTPGDFGMGGDPANLFKSTDGGENWSIANVGIPGNDVISLVAGPASSVYASYGDVSYGIVKSTNGGTSWSTVNIGLPTEVPRIFSVALNPANPTTIFAGYFDLLSGHGGVFRTINGGENWSDSSRGLEVLDVHAIAIDPVSPRTVYVASGDGVSKSVDGGADWQTIHFVAAGPGTTFVPSLLVDPGNPNILYASIESSGGCYASDPFLRKSSDGGATWNDLSPNYCAFGPTVSLALDPGDSNTLYAVPQDDADCGAYVYGTTDEGRTWNQSFVEGALVASLAIRPGNPPSLYAGLIGYSSGGVLKSTDNGKTWVATALTGVGVSVLALDPRNPDILFAGTSKGLFKTTDGNATWSAINTTLTTGAVITALVIDPKLSVLYMGTSGAGVFKSLDGGTRWTALNNGLKGLDIRALALSSDGSGVIYAGTSAGIFTAVDKQESGRLSGRHDAGQ